MNIISTTVTDMSIAVDRFSGTIGSTMIALTMSMYLKAFLSAPSLVCMALSICATASTKAPLPISDGWNCMPRKFIQRLASLVACPATSTHSSVTKENKSRKGVTNLKYLHFTLSTTTIIKVPMASIPQCFRIGLQ